jgi:hypothetical protein
VGTLPSASFTSAEKPPNFFFMEGRAFGTMFSMLLGMLECFPKIGASSSLPSLPVVAVETKLPEGFAELKLEEGLKLPEGFGPSSSASCFWNREGRRLPLNFGGLPGSTGACA